MARILCIESGTEICSVALAVDGELISLRESEAVRNHIHDLALYVREILQENDLDPSDDIDAVAVGAGPGSYTGLRISGSTAKGLCYGMKKPLIAIDSLRCLAAVARQEYDSGILTIEDPSMALLVPMIDARRMEVYTAVYDMKLNELEPTSAHVLTPSSFAKYIASGHEVVIFGDGSLKAAELLGSAVQHRRVSSSARGLAMLAEGYFNCKEFVDTAYWEPNYLKNFVATTSAKKLF